MAEAEIAEPAEQAAHQIGDVAMIDAELLRRPLSADRAQATLALEQCVVLLGRDPVVIFQPRPALALCVVLALLAVGIGILGPFAPALGVDRVFVREIKRQLGGAIPVVGDQKNRFAGLGFKICAQFFDRTGGRTPAAQAIPYRRESLFQCLHTRFYAPVWHAARPLPDMLER